MGIPKTAGSFLSESRLRAYVKCSQFYEFGGQADERVSLIVVRKAIENITAIRLANTDLDPNSLISSAVSKALIQANKSLHLTDTQLETEARSATLMVADFFTYFSLAKYIPIYGPIDYIVRVSRTPIELHVSGIYQSKKNQTLHLVDFSPYTEQLDKKNDPVVHLKLQTFKPFVKSHFQRAEAQMHIFSVSQAIKLSYASYDTNNVSEDYLAMIDGTIRLMEAGYHFPLVPCPYSCRFKTICEPKEI